MCSRRTHDHHCAFYLSVDRDTTSRYGKHYFQEENMIGESKVNRCPVAWSTLCKNITIDYIFFDMYLHHNNCTLESFRWSYKILFINCTSAWTNTFESSIRFKLPKFQTSSLNFLWTSIISQIRKTLHVFHDSNYFHLYFMYTFHFQQLLLKSSSSNVTNKLKQRERLHGHLIL